MPQNNTPFSYKKQQESAAKISVWLPLLVFAAIAVGMLVGFNLHKRTRPPLYIQADGSVSSKFMQTSKIDEVLKFINARYIEPADIEKLEDAATRGVIKELDPHSSYISRSEIESVNESLSGGFQGIGVEFFVVDDSIYIVGVIPNGPSDKAGLKVGDRIVAVGDSSAIGEDNKKIIDRLKGQAGTSVEITIVRGSNNAKENITIQRGEIPILSIDIAYMLNESVGYIKINRFSDRTYKEFMEALEELIEQHKMKDLIIDLRYNGGGYLTAATDILNQIFDAKKMLVYTEGRSYKRKEYNSTGKPFFNLGKIAVLIDEGSASASEIMAGAIQDNDRGIIVGRRSFGKGLVQEQYPLSDGSAIRLTVAKYYTPSGRLIQKPYQNGDEDVYNEELKHRLQNGELSNTDSFKLVDTTKYYTQAGRVVYGGGGIMPDIFVPIDSIYINKNYAIISAYIAPFIYKFMNTERQVLAKYKTYEEFDSAYELPSKIMTSFEAYLQEKNIKVAESALKSTEIISKVTLNMRAYIGQQLFRDEGYYKTLHKDDAVLTKAINALKETK